MKKDWRLNLVKKKLIVKDIENTYVVSSLKNVQFDGTIYIVTATDHIANEDEIEKYECVTKLVDYYIGLDNMVIINAKTKECLSEENDNELYYKILERFYE